MHTYKGRATTPTLVDLSLSLSLSPSLPLTPSLSLPPSPNNNNNPAPPSPAAKCKIEHPLRLHEFGSAPLASIALRKSAWP